VMYLRMGIETYVGVFGRAGAGTTGGLAGFGRVGTESPSSSGPWAETKALSKLAYPYLYWDSKFNIPERNSEDD